VIYCVRIEQKLAMHLEMYTPPPAVFSPATLTAEGKIKFLMTLNFTNNYLMS